MRFTSILPVALVATAVFGAIVPAENGQAIDNVKRDAQMHSRPYPNYPITAADPPDETPTEEPTGPLPSLPVHSQLPPPPEGTVCDPHCICATGGKPVPQEGRYLCGWCAAVSTEPQYFLNVTDLVLCKDGGCCNFGLLDGRCEAALLQNPPDYETWCPWPVQQVDPPPSDTPSSATLEPTTLPGTPTVTVPETTILPTYGRH